jgi:hypothetical protein
MSQNWDDYGEACLEHREDSMLAKACLAELRREGEEAEVRRIKELMG